MQNNIVEINAHNLKKANAIIKSINHKTRLQILNLLYLHKQLTVTQIQIQLQLSQSITSQHLANLRRAGFVNTYKENKFVYYSYNADAVNAFYNNILQLVTTH